MMGRRILLPNRFVFLSVLIIFVFYNSGSMRKSVINNQPGVRFGFFHVAWPSHFSSVKPVVSAIRAKSVRAILVKKESIYEQKCIG